VFALHVAAGDYDVAVSVTVTPKGTGRPRQFPIRVQRTSRAVSTRLRLNIYQLSDEVLASFFRAMQLLKDLGVYDYFAFIHNEVGSTRLFGGFETDAHKSPSFPVWHRVFIDVFERAIMAAGFIAGLGLPYWVFWEERGCPGNDVYNPLKGGCDQAKMLADPEGLKSKNCIWAPSYFGLGTGGFASRLRLKHDPFVKDLGTSTPRRPKRNFAANNWKNAHGADNGGMPGKLTMIRTMTKFSMFRDNLESLHDNCHNAIGTTSRTTGREVFADMGSLTSPNDPIFWMVHSGLEKLFTEWQSLARTGTDDPCDAFYGNSTVSGGKTYVHLKTDRMAPWGVIVQDWLLPAAGVVYSNQCTEANCAKCFKRITDASQFNTTCVRSS